MIKKVLQYGLPVILAGALFYYAFKDFEFEKVLQSLGNASPALILLTLIPQTLSHFSRAWRWQILIKPIGFTPSFKNVFLAVMSGYFANLIVPRMGEVTRCGVLLKTDDIPLTASVGTVVTERLIDLLTLGVIVLIALGFEYDTLGGFISSMLSAKSSAGGQSSGFPVLPVLAGLAALGGVGFYLLKDKLLKISIVAKLYGFAVQLFEAVFSIRKMEKPGAFLFHSLFIWAMYFTTHMILTLSYGPVAHLWAMPAVVVFIAGTLGMIAPVQGGIGAYHFLVSSALITLYGVTKDDAIAFALLAHTVGWVYMIVVGGVAFVIGTLTKNTAKAAV